MKTTVRFGLLVSAFALAFAAVSSAVAAPVPWASMDITVLEDQGQTVYLVAGQLPEDAKLPAEVQLSMPKGAQLQWAGELMSADGTGDFEVKYTKTTKGDSDIYTMTVTKSRVAQIEAIVPGGISFDGTTYVADIAWTPIADVSSARISMRIPSNASITQTGQGETGQLVPGDQTSAYFTKTVENVKAGTPLTLQFAYALGAPVAGGTAGGNNSLIVALIVALAVAAFGLAIVAIRKKAAVSGEMVFGEDDDEDEVTAGPVAEDTAPVADVADGDEDSTADPLLDDGSAAPRSKAPMMVLLGVVAVAVLVGVLAGNRSTTAQNLGGEITRTYGTGDACTTARIPVTPAEGVDLTAEGNTILAALEQVPGIGSATILADQGLIEIGYCDTSASENDLRSVLSATGLLEVAAASTPATETTPTAE